MKEFFDQRKKFGFFMDLNIFRLQFLGYKIENCVQAIAERLLINITATKLSCKYGEKIADTI